MFVENIVSSLHIMHFRDMELHLLWYFFQNNLYFKSIISISLSERAVSSNQHNWDLLFGAFFTHGFITVRIISAISQFHQPPASCTNLLNRAAYSSYWSKAEHEDNLSSELHRAERSCETKIMNVSIKLRFIKTTLPHST